jgi:hypothetical protein
VRLPPCIGFRRAIERRALWLAEDAARELPNLPPEDALQLGELRSVEPEFASTLRIEEHELEAGSLN